MKIIHSNQFESIYNGRNQSSAGEPAGWAGAKKVVGTLPGGPGRE
jgi:hypothetical protein